jgi:hypothetical protein
MLNNALSSTQLNTDVTTNGPSSPYKRGYKMKPKKELAIGDLVYAQQYFPGSNKTEVNKILRITYTAKWKVELNGWDLPYRPIESLTLLPVARKSEGKWTKTTEKKFRVFRGEWELVKRSSATESLFQWNDQINLASPTNMNEDKDFVLKNFPNATLRMCDDNCGGITYQVIIHNTGYEVGSSRYVATASSEKRVWKSARTRAVNLMKADPNATKKLKELGNTRKTLNSNISKELISSFPSKETWKIEWLNKKTFGRIWGVDIAFKEGQEQVCKVSVVLGDDEYPMWKIPKDVKKPTESELVLWKLES